jgi:hypothetical protein
MNQKFNFYIRIVLILLIAFLLSKSLSNNIFLADSPKIRPNLDTYFLAKINTTKDNILAKLNFNFSFPKNNFVANQSRNQTIEFLKNNLHPITKGVSAATRDNYSYTEYKVNEIEWVRVTYTLKNGKTINIEYPKGTNPPPQGIYENQ